MVCVSAPDGLHYPIYVLQEQTTAKNAYEIEYIHDTTTIFYTFSDVTDPNRYFYSEQYCILSILLSGQSGQTSAVTPPVLLKARQTARATVASIPVAANLAP